MMISRENAKYLAKLSDQDMTNLIRLTNSGFRAENVKYVRALAEGKVVRSFTGCIPAQYIEYDFTAPAECYQIYEPKRVCNGVELDKPLRQEDVTPETDVLYLVGLSEPSGIVAALAYGVGTREFERGIVYATEASADKHFRAIMKTGIAQ